ncbi:MAG: sensor histidine kinase [bacterium]|nr:sensor histidine kinase [bacterium]
MSFIGFLKGKVAYVITNGIVFGLLVLNLHLFRYSSYLIYLTIIGGLVSTILPILLEYIKKRGFYNAMATCVDSLEKKYIICELVPRPNFIEGAIVYDGLRQINQNMMDEIKTYKHRMKDYKEYIDLWVHEIKTPVTNVLLLTTNYKNEVTTSIEEEMEKIEGYIEQTLYYSKMSLVEKDYVISSISLSELVKGAVKHNKKMLIGNGIQVHLYDLDYTVNTDEKWCAFVLGQIITNCVKYRNEKAPRIEFYAKKEEQNITLFIRDNGIGIKEGEIEKVLMKGFVGTNGRKREATTGMGLYLCNKLLTKMHHRINVTSTEGGGTTVVIVFPKTNFFLLN